MQPPPPSVEAGTHRVSLDVRPVRGFGGGPGGRPAPSPPADACHPPNPAAAKNPPPPVSTQRRPRTAGLPPGSYTVRLTVDGETLTQPVTLQPDPRHVPEGSESNAFSANNQ